jgi:hypothetical protein
VVACSGDNDSDGNGDADPPGSTISHALSDGGRLMKRKRARMVLTATLALGILILAWRGIHFVLVSHLPASFTLKLDGIPWKCTSSGNTISCNSFPVHVIRPELR